MQEHWTGLLSLLSDSARQHLLGRGKVFKLSKKGGENVIFLDNDVYLITEGCAFVSCFNQEGKRVILDILTSGSFFGNFNGTPRASHDCFFLEPLRKAIVYKIPQSVLLEVLRQEPEFAVELLSKISSKLLQLEEKTGALALEDTKRRILTELVRIGREHGVENGDKLEFCLGINQEELGGLVGAARETVSKLLNDLRKQGAITYDKNCFVVNLNSAQ